MVDLQLVRGEFVCISPCPQRLRGLLESTVTQQDCEVSLGASGQIRAASGKKKCGAVGHTTTSQMGTSAEDSREADGHTAECVRLASSGQRPSVIVVAHICMYWSAPSYPKLW